MNKQEYLIDSDVFLGKCLNKFRGNENLDWNT